MRSLQQASKQARRDRLEHLIQQAEQAAQSHCQSELYRVINAIAPRKRHDKVRISPEGKVLSQKQEFEAIYNYFSTAFSRQKPYNALPLTSLGITQTEIQEAIPQLKNNKAVPPSSLPAEMWKLCPEECSAWLSAILECSIADHSLPSEMADCTLSLLPKPGRTTRLPKDLRPLGLQDQSSKIVAIVLRARLLAIVRERLDTVPQYAYCPQKAIDQAISRVARHCRTIRELVRHNTLTTHERRDGKQCADCKGSLMVSLDPSRAFDLLGRQALDASLLSAGVPDDLRAAVLMVHETCRYHVRHGTYQDTFATQVGVRQGCARSPLLYALYTAWLHERIASETSEGWAQHFMTIFADDKHLSWETHSLEDLHFVSKCVQITFRLLKESGMQVNPEKSKIVVALRSSAAKRWLHSSVLLMVSLSPWAHRTSHCGFSRCNR